MSGVVVAIFAALVAAMLALWAPRVSALPGAAWWWTVPFAGALLLALASGVVEPLGRPVSGIRYPVPGDRTPETGPPTPETGPRRPELRVWVGRRLA